MAARKEEEAFRLLTEGILVSGESKKEKGRPERANIPQDELDRESGEKKRGPYFR